MQKNNNDKNVLSLLNSAADANFNSKAERYAYNSEGDKVRIKEDHAYAFSRIDSDFIYFKDPHALNEELQIPVKEFADNFYGAISVKLKD